MTKAVLAVTGSDYTKYVGGTNKLILSHQKIFIDHGYIYICIFPYRIFDRNKDKNSNYWCVRANGDLRAVVHTNDLSNYLIGKDICVEEIHVHQLLNISVDLSDKLFSTFNTTHIRVFLHDYQYICKNYLMLRNDSMFCGSEPPSEDKCDNCKYYTLTKIHYDKMQTLFNKYNNTIEMIAPSKYVEDFYRKCFPDLKITTVPHQVPIGHYHKTTSINSTIKVAFVGYANRTKGWEDFEKATRNFADDRVVFLHYGKGGENNSSITHVLVDTSCNPNDMVDSLRRDQVDICILWSIVPETYSYTYNESIMAGAYILTNHRSGNIAQSVLQDRTGTVLNDVEELRCLITDYDKLNAIRRQCNYKAPQSFVDNEWVYENLGHTSGKKSKDYKKVYDQVALKVIYSLKWMVKGK